MTATEILYLVLAFIAGIGLAGLHFAGLWLTISKLATSKHPGVLTMLSLLVRLSLTLTAIYFVMGGHWQRLLACVVGFFIARLVAVRIWGPNGNTKISGKTHGRDDHATREEAVAHGHHS